MMLFTTLLLSAFAAGYHLPEPPNCSEEELMNGYNHTLRGGWMDLSMYHTWPRDLNPPIWELSTELSTSLRRQAFARKKRSGQCHLRKWITLLYQHPASFLQPVPPCQEIDPSDRDQCSFVLPRLWIHWKRHPERGEVSFRESLLPQVPASWHHEAPFSGDSSRCGAMDCGDLPLDESKDVPQPWDDDLS